MTTQCRCAVDSEVMRVSRYRKRKVNIGIIVFGLCRLDVKLGKEDPDLQMDLMWGKEKCKVFLCSFFIWLFSVFVLLISGFHCN